MSRLRAIRPVHLGLLLPWVLVGIASRREIRDNSFLWHVRAGTIQIERGSVLTTDPFSFTFGGRPWRTQSWLAELAYGWLDARWGLGFVPWMLGVLGVLIFAGLLVLVYRQTKNLGVTVVAGVLSAWLGAVFFNPRPVLFSYLFLVLLLAALWDDRMRWSVPLVIWIWAAVHASFVLGLAVIFLESLRRRLKTKELIGFMAPAVVVPLFTAHGWGVVEFMVEFVSRRDALRYLTEWSVPDLLSPPFVPVLILIAMLLVAAIRGRVRIADLWLVVPLLAVMVSSARSVFPAWLVLVPLAASGVESVGLGGRGGSPGINALLGLVLLAGPVMVPVRGGLDRERFPVEAAAALIDVPTFNDDVAGGYLIYSRYPAFEVFVDDRAELYGADHFEAAIEARNGTPTWREVFESWRIRQAIVRTDAGLVAALTESGWRTVYRDENFVVFRTDPS